MISFHLIKRWWTRPSVENDIMIEYEYFPWCQLVQLYPIKDDEDNMWWGWSWARTSQARPILTSSAVSFPRTQGPHTAAAHKALSSFQALSQSLFSFALSLVSLIVGSNKLLSIWDSICSNVSFEIKDPSIANSLSIPLPFCRDQFSHTTVQCKVRVKNSLSKSPGTPTLTFQCFSYSIFWSF